MRLPLLPGRILEHRSAESRTLLRLIADNRGVTAIEYTLIAALIALVFVALIEQIGDFVSTPFDTIAGQL